MAPIKFEEQIKEKLEKRELTPSTESWSKLSSRLDNETKQPRVRPLWWLAIAASLVLIFTISYSYFSSDIEFDNNQLVEEEVVTPQIELDHDPVIKNVDKGITEQTEITEESTEKVSTPNPSKVKSVISQKLQSKTTIEVAEVPEQLEQQIEDKVKSPSIELIDKELIDSAVADVINKTDSNEVTDKEVDSLLKLASKALLKDKLLIESAKTVDADALLESVQDDMGQSFRTRVFEALKGSYKTVKTAVVERNN